MKLLNIYESIQTRDMFEDVNEGNLLEVISGEFDTEEFKKIRSYTNNVKYPTEHVWKSIGRGSSIIVL